LTPGQGSDPQAVEKLKRFWLRWAASGCDGACHHDLVLHHLAILPHLIAYNIVGTAHRPGKGHRRRSDQNIRLRASAISPASRHPIPPWAESSLNNRDAVLEVLDGFNEDLAQVAAGGAANGRRQDPVRLVHSHPRHPPRHHRYRPGYRGAQFGRLPFTYVPPPRARKAVKKRSRARQKGRQEGAGQAPAQSQTAPKK